MQITTQSNVTGLPWHKLDKVKIKQGLRECAKAVKKDSQKRLNTVGRSNAGAYPAKSSGDLRRAVQIVAGKKGKTWVRVQVGSIFTKGKKIERKRKMWYAGVLNYGSKKRNIKPRANAIKDAEKANTELFHDLMEDVFIDAITKG